ncbi:MAG: hypothetical protein WCK35_30010 [Chloroflexota bacterium]
MNALHALGVNFIMGGNGLDESLHTHPVRLISELAQSDEARLRLSLIPLFLEYPQYAAYLRTVARKLEPAALLTLRCYYTAAVFLAKKYQLTISLPDLFSGDLGLGLVDGPEENLRLLAKRHKQLSGSYVNWLATYKHAEDVWQKGLEYRKRVTLG